VGGEGWEECAGADAGTEYSGERRNKRIDRRRGDGGKAHAHDQGLRSGEIRNGKRRIERWWDRWGRKGDGE